VALVARCALVDEPAIPERAHALRVSPFVVRRVCQHRAIHAIVAHVELFAQQAQLATAVRVVVLSDRACVVVPVFPSAPIPTVVRAEMRVVPASRGAVSAAVAVVLVALWVPAVAPGLPAALAIAATNAAQNAPL
jgi:hypothetical protein